MENRIIGSYRLLRQTRINGFQNTYYIGEHIDLHYQVLIAIHIKQNDMSDEKFLQEAQFARLFDYPHVVGVLDYGVIEEGFFEVTRYIEGQNMQSAIRSRYGNGQLPAYLIVKYISELADALQYVHDVGIVHRDVKPTNFILDKDDEVWLTDFGVAVVLPEGTSSIEQDPTGTPRYMAPEQFRGIVSPAIDQYALAVIAYEWISGTLPFVGHDIMQLAWQHMQASPSSLREKISSLPEAVEQVVFKGLAKDPNDRFPNIWEFAKALSAAYSFDQPIRSGQHTISIRIKEKPLTAQNLIITLSTLTDLYTKSWLIQQGRFADLMDYAQTHDSHFAKEAHFRISKLTYNSPALIDFLVSSASIAGTATLALALKTAIDAVIQAPLRFRTTQLLNQKEALELKIREQEAQQSQQISAQKAETEIKTLEHDNEFAIQKAQMDLERQLALLDLTKQQIAIEKQQLELDRQHLEMEKDRVKIVLEITKTMVNQLQPDSDVRMQEMLMHSLVPSLLQLATSEGLELVLPASQKREEEKSSEK